MTIRTALARAQNELATVFSNLLAAPGEAAGLWRAGLDALQSVEGVRGFAYLLILVVVGAGLEWLYWIYASPALRWLVAGDPRTRVEAWRIAGRRIAIGLCAVAVSTLSILGTAGAFTWPASLLDIVTAVTLAVAAVRALAVIVRALLSPDSSRLRLVRMRTPEAKIAVPAILTAAGVLAGGIVLPDVIEPYAPAVAGAVRALTVLVGCCLVVAAIVIAERRRRPVHQSAVARRRLRILPPPLLAALWCGFIVLLWLSGGPRWSLTLAIASLTIAAETLSRRFVRTFWEAWRTDRMSASETADASPGSLYEDLSLRLVRFVVALAGVIACAIVWDVPLLAMPGGETPTGRFMLRVLGALALLLAADVAWAAIRGAVDARLARVALAGDPETGANARLLTLLPLARKASGVTLLVLLVLSLMSIFGIEITPLLAGAGVLGIAVGFGAQTLVRDVLSGVFYLAEDVFRIGDYIEGGNAKGTVERITLRTVALRHQNGPLHFVPYGALGSVRNNSRDWVIDKFEIPLPPDVDSEKVRKLIKSIGQAMLEDPELAPFIVAPLKAKLYRIEPGVKVFRCKIQTPPGKQFEVRGAAFKRIETGLREAGIPFADSRSQVVLQGALAAGVAGQPANA
ncbi:mechanosensitive ion channel family protein [uncultured Alsobacter sp.]|uniref:mechanosensitive ion channel family protein n=1 Tax=uncultured Alsobacter sp. TaxID=1748258 RepID=UPI0025FD6681|nr:mechanosensitive ion channel family protein [uncultured Alsobacter sp.]